MRGQKKIFGKIEEREQKLPQIKEIGTNYNHALFERLREKRKELADKANVPPYVIFPDKTLIQMAAVLPLSRDQLLQIHGVGTVKCQKYGHTFIELLRQYSQAHPAEVKQK